MRDDIAMGHMPGVPPLAVSVVIVNYRTKELTGHSVASVLTEPEVHEVVVMDNASGDGSVEYLRAAFDDSRLRVLQSGTNLGFGPAVNLAAQECGAPMMLILNSDATLVSRSLGRLARALAADDSASMIAPAVYEDDGSTLQPAAFGRLPTRRDAILPGGWTRAPAEGSSDARSPGWVSGVAMLVRRADFLAVGGFDEGFEMYFEDIDLCRRLRQSGRAVLRDSSAAVVHHGGKSWQSRREQKRRFHESKLRYFQKLGLSTVELTLVRLTSTFRTHTIHD